MQDEENFDNYLIATIKLPIKVSIDGNLYTLNDYVNITIEKMIDTPIKSTDSIYDKVVEYITRHPQYFTPLGSSGTNVHVNDVGGQRCKRRKGQFRDFISDESEESVTENVVDKPELNESLLHSFPYFNRRKKPLNITFRAKGKSRSFTKKHYF
jgi:hypothetical protein